MYIQVWWKCLFDLYFGGGSFWFSFNVLFVSFCVFCTYLMCLYRPRFIYVYTSVVEVSIWSLCFLGSFLFSLNMLFVSSCVFCMYLMCLYPPRWHTSVVEMLILSVIFFSCFLLMFDLYVCIALVLRPSASRSSIHVFAQSKVYV